MKQRCDVVVSTRLKNQSSRSIVGVDSRVSGCYVYQGGARALRERRASRFSRDSVLIGTECSWHASVRVFLDSLPVQKQQYEMAGVAEVYLHRLQSVQIAAARLLSGARCHNHITPVLETLHWLPLTSSEEDYPQCGGIGVEVPPQYSSSLPG